MLIAANLDNTGFICLGKSCNGDFNWLLQLLPLPVGFCAESIGIHPTAQFSPTIIGP